MPTLHTPQPAPTSTTPTLDIPQAAPTSTSPNLDIPQPAPTSTTPTLDTPQPAPTSTTPNLDTPQPAPTSTTPTANVSPPDSVPSPTMPSTPDDDLGPIHVAATPANAALPTPPTHIQLAADGDWVPSSCTLPTAEQPLRQAEFDDLFSTAVQTIHRPTPTTLDLEIPTTAEATARDLADREVGCCNFFTFDFHPCTTDTRTLRIGVPDSPTYLAVLDALESRARRHLRTTR